MFTHSKLKNILVIAIIILFSKITSVYSQNLSSSFASIVDATTPAVVNVSTMQSVEVRNPFDDFRFSLPDGDQQELFKDLFEREFGFSEPKTRKAASLGSGFIIDPDGYIVTNAHVVNGADEISVTLSNDPDKNYKAKLIGLDIKTDIALLKIEAKDLPFLKFSDSDKARVGDHIIAIGNPFGLGGTVTSGIISAKSRLLPGLFDEFLQIDASINRGNSGGPVINLNNEVVGISSVIISPSSSGASVGIGLAIPSNLAQPIIKQLREKGVVTRGWLGVKIQPVSEEIAKIWNLPNTKGALVAEVIKDSPAEKAGIKVGDIIVKFDGQDINKVQKLSRLAGTTEIGKKVAIEFLRDGKNLNSEVKIEKTIESQEEESAVNKTKEDISKFDASFILGMKLENINPALKQRFALEKETNGIVITRIKRDSPAQNIGLRVGDVIKRLNKIDINNVDQFEKSLNEIKKTNPSEILLLITRSGSNLFVVVPLE